MGCPWTTCPSEPPVGTTSPQPCARNRQEEAPAAHSGGTGRLGWQLCCAGLSLDFDLSGPLHKVVAVTCLLDFLSIPSVEANLK